MHAFVSFEIALHVSQLLSFLIFLVFPAFNRLGGNSLFFFYPCFLCHFFSSVFELSVLPRIHPLIRDPHVGQCALALAARALSSGRGHRKVATPLGMLTPAFVFTFPAFLCGSPFCLTYNIYLLYLLGCSNNSCLLLGDCLILHKYAMSQHMHIPCLHMPFDVLYVFYFH